MLYCRLSSRSHLYVELCEFSSWDKPRIKDLNESISRGKNLDWLQIWRILVVYWRETLGSRFWLKKKKIVFIEFFQRKYLETQSCYLKIGNVSRRKCLVSFPVAFHCLHVLSDKESNVRKGRGRGGRLSGKLPEMEGSCKTGPVQADFWLLSFPNVLPEVNHQWLMGLAYSSKADLSWEANCSALESGLFWEKGTAVPPESSAYPRCYRLQPFLSSVYSSNSVGHCDCRLLVFFFKEILHS